MRERFCKFEGLSAVAPRAPGTKGGAVRAIAGGAFIQLPWTIFMCVSRPLPPFSVLGGAPDTTAQNCVFWQAGSPTLETPSPRTIDFPPASAGMGGKSGDHTVGSQGARALRAGPRSSTWSSEPSAARSAALPQVLHGVGSVADSPLSLQRAEPLPPLDPLYPVYIFRRGEGEVRVRLRDPSMVAGEKQGEVG